jgi:hypothetical protein
MVIAIVILAVLIVLLFFFVWRFRSAAEELKQRLIIAAPYIVRSDAPFEEIEPLFGFGEWKEIAKGGNVNPGRFGGRGSCPCQSEYTVANNQVIINAWPNPAQVAACANNPPPPQAAWWKCPDDCVQVMTHMWRGWTVVKNRKNGQLRFNCYTFAQFHCKKPGDPDIEKPPKMTDPNDPIQEL